MATSTAQPTGNKAQPRPSREKPFALTLDLESQRVTLSLRQSRLSLLPESYPNGRNKGQDDRARRLLTLNGRRAKILQPLVLEALHRSGASIARLEEKKVGRARLAEAEGARLALTLWALAPLQKPSRASLVQAGISAMSDEEVYYWYAKAEGGPSTTSQQRRNNTLKALRILLAGE